ncbi:calcium-activated chloride channel regulator 2-like [Artemia franciscana]|uniref:calcium-activated chloride channel regulator 2-like n=1 Tax=Artemia franciscana TaxID=6661 RepID=UPI0032D9D3AF
MSSIPKILIFFGILFNFALCKQNKISVVNGGYKDVIIGIADNIVVPDEENFIERLKGLFLTTSEKLNEATRNAVYFDEIIISVPSNWSLGTETTRFSATTFENAHIRIVNADDSPLGHAPWTSHSGLCGIQGDYISVTKEFIEGDDQFVQQFGSKEKALIHEWAHFRWGVFDEYGFPGDARFPYFYFPPEKTEQVAVYSASADLAGVSQKIDGTTCVANDSGIYADDCRFFPNIDNTTSVSLMSFHYLPGALQFDDLAYHRKSVPSKQNQLCNYQSIWETMMKNNEDFLDTGTVARPTTFKIVKRLSLPVIFTIFDVGQRSLNTDVEIMKSHLLSASQSFVGRHFGFATYSSAGAIKFDVCLPIHYLEDCNEVERALSTVTQRNDITSTFSYPIDRAIRAIAEYGAPAGAILYVIGYSGTDYRNGYLEPHILSLALENRIKVIGQESSFFNGGMGYQLQGIVNITGGAGPFQFPGPFSKDELDRNFNYAQSNLDKSINLGGKTLVSEAVANAEEHTLSFRVDVLNTGNDKLRIFVTGLRFGSGIVGACSFKVHNGLGWEDHHHSQSNWGGWESQWSSNNVLLVWNAFARSGIYILKITCATTSSFWVDIILQTNNRAYPNFEPAVDDLIKIKLLPSATSPENVAPPLQISAKPLNGQYNVGNLKVKAHVRNVFSIPLHPSQHFTIDLLDDGFGDPDIFQDGIYSGMLVPPNGSLSSGKYSIGIEVLSEQSSWSISGGQMSIAADQSQICCGSSFPTKSLFLPSEYRRYFPDLWTFTVSSFSTKFKPPKVTISDLFVLNTVDSDLLITMKWISPRGSATDGSAPVSRYVIHYSSNINFLLDGNFSVVDEIIYCNPVTPGHVQTCEFIISEFTEITAFFRVAAVAGGEMGNFSTIVWSQPLREPSTETTPKTATTVYFTNTTFDYTTLDANNSTQIPCIDVRCKPWLLPVVIVVPTASVIAIAILAYLYCFKKLKKPSGFFENLPLSFILR